MKINRWARLIASTIAMIMIANLQYAWTFFVKPIMGATGWKLSEVQWGFTLFIAFETWMMPLSGWFMDRFGPRLFMSISALLCGLGWAGLGYAKSLPELYVLYSLAGFGAAMVYCGSTTVGLKWFPDKLGFASGIIAAGFGAGAALFIILMTYIIRVEIRVDNYRAAFLYTGIAQAVVIFCVAQILINPDPNDPEIAGKKPQSRFKRTMIVAFLIQALALVSVLRLGRNSPAGFITCLAIVFFTWGEIYSIFPAVSADFFGGRNASSNYSLLYSSKGMSAILAGGLAALIFEKSGSWTVVFYGSATLAFLAAIMSFGLIAMPLPTKQQASPAATAVKSVEP